MISTVEPVLLAVVGAAITGVAAFEIAVWAPGTLVETAVAASVSAVAPVAWTVPATVWAVSLAAGATFPPQAANSAAPLPLIITRNSARRVSVLLRMGSLPFRAPTLGRPYDYPLTAPVAMPSTT